ncbi:DinB family protein [Chitinophaga rhizosphaerae]|uniref:DinB family protein n=1 Tax=Chitinophaga rhizosphaerae TaxID=1864947 RepID=UPI000F80F43B|nr:DinB family protein [Chitinophaga rhizosphaerae]
MATIPSLLKEMAREAETTRKMLSRIPTDKLDWRPHPKSMDMRNLAIHIAELPSWTKMAIETDELDFAAMQYAPPAVSNAGDLVAIHEKALQEGISSLEQADESTFGQPWTLRTGDQVHAVSPKEEVIRMSYNQIVHHRAQLGVYLRLLEVPIPGSYGPSADEPAMSNIM